MGASGTWPLQVVIGVALAWAGGAAAQPAGPIVLTEIDYRSAADLPEDEFMEILNVTEEAVDLSGWRMSDGVSFLFPEGTNLPPGGYLVICRNAIRFAALRGLRTGVLGDFEGRLSDEGERITIVDDRGARIDRVDYDDDPPWPQEADGGGPTLACVDPLQDNDDPRNWLPSLEDGGTPGRPNGVASTNLPPFIGAFAVDPRIPGPRDDVLLEAFVTDADGIGSVTAWYKPGGWFLKLPLGDDGRGPDRDAGDGLYVGRIPAAPAGTLLDYRIEAQDARGARAAVRRGTYAVIDPEVSTCLPVYRIFVRPDDWEWLGQHIWDPTYVPAFFVAEDAIFPEAGLRFRGGRPRLFRKKSLKIRVDDEWRFFGRSRLNLNAAAMDDDYITEPLAYWFYDRCGMPASRTEFVRVQRNGAFWGLFIDVEQVDEAYLESRGLDPKGALYKAVGIASSLRPLEQPIQGTRYRYEQQYEKKTRLDEGYEDLIAFIHDLQDPPGGAEAYLRTHLDVRGFCDYLAATNLMCVWDGIQHNFYLYRDTRGDGRWHVLPWDLDHAWGEWEWYYYYGDTYPLLMGTKTSPFAGVWYAWSQLWSVFLGTPVFRDMYFDRLRELLNTEFTEWVLFPKIDALCDRIEEEVLLDEAKWPDAQEPLHAGPRRTMAQEIPRLKENIRRRRRYLAQRLGVRLLEGPPGTRFIRGDTDGSGALDLADAIAVLLHLFAGGAVDCADAADVDDDGALDLADAIGLLGHLFVGGPAPAPPFPACGTDPTEDELDCARYPGC